MQTDTYVYTIDTFDGDPWTSEPRNLEELNETQQALAKTLSVAGELVRLETQDATITIERMEGARQ